MRNVVPMPECYLTLHQWGTWHPGPAERTQRLVSRLEGSVGLRIGEPLSDLDDCLGALGPLERFREVAVVNCDVAV